MNLVAIALLCSIYPSVKEKQDCQKYFINCIDKKREEEISKLTFPVIDVDKFLSECVLEKK